MPVSTPKEFIEVMLPTKLTVDKLEGLDMIIQFSITGTNAGDWFIAIKNNKVETVTGVSPTPTISI